MTFNILHFKSFSFLYMQEKNTDEKRTYPISAAILDASLQTTSCTSLGEGTKENPENELVAMIFVYLYWVHKRKLLKQKATHERQKHISICQGLTLI